MSSFALSDMNAHRCMSVMYVCCMNATYCMYVTTTHFVTGDYECVCVFLGILT